MTVASQRPGTGASFAITVLLTSFVAATYGFGFYLFSQLVTDMRADLGFDYGTVGVITASAQAGFLAFALAGTWLSGRLGSTQVVVYSVALCGACLLLLPTTDSVLVVGFLLAVMGGTAASAYVPLVEIVGRVIRKEHHGKVLGLLSSGTSYGVVINSLLVPEFVRDDNWRGLWYVVGSSTVMVTVVAAVVFWRVGLFRRGPRSATAPAERAGGPVGVRGLLTGWVLIVWTMTFLNGFTAMPFQNYLSPYLRDGLGFGVGYAATVWGAIGVIGMVSGFAVGAMADRTGIRTALLFSYGCFLAAAVILVTVPIGPMPMVAGVLFAIAFYPVFGLIPAYVSKMATGAAVTVVFGIANVTQGIGGIAGNYLAGLSKTVTGGFMGFYVVIAVAVIVLGVLTLRLPWTAAAGRAQDTDAREPVPQTSRSMT